jgi:hypothetical protein
VTTRTVTQIDRTKTKSPRESSRRPGPSVQSTLGVAKPTRKRQKETPWNSKHNMSASICTGRSVIVRRNGAGETLDTVRIDNDPVVLAAELAKAGEHPEVILEATYGWYWAADVIQECGGTVHLAHPLGNNWGNRRVKNDERDATDLVDLLRLGRWLRPGSPRHPCVSSVSTSVMRPSSSTCARTSSHKSTPSWPKRVWPCP